ncbi:MAG: AsmA family protein [Gammaproteobacteria bacterium]
MRSLKITAVVVATILVLLVGGAVALLAFVDPNDYRDDIQQLAKEKTGRDLTIAGELDLDLFPWLALRMEKVTLGNPPGYGSEPFASVEQASVGVKLMPLLRKQVEVSRIAVEQLALNLVSRNETENNWKDLAQSDDTGEGETAGGEGTASIAGIDVTRSRLAYRDEAEDSVMRLANLEVHTGRIGSDRPVPMRLEFDYDEGEAEPLAHVKLEGLAKLPRDASRIELTDAKVEGRWDTAPFTMGTPSLVLDWGAETLAPATLDVTYGALAMKLTAAGEKLFGDRVVAGRVSVREAEPQGVLRSLGIEPPTTSDPNALSKLTLQGDYRLTENVLRVSDLDLTLDETRVRGSAGIDDIEKFVLGFDLAVDGIDVDRYLEPKPAEGGEGSDSTSATELPIEALRELNARGRLTIGRAKLSGLEFSNVRLPLEARTGLVRAGPTSAQLFGGKYAGNIVLDARPAQARLSLDERVTNIDIGAVMKAAFDSTRLAGRGNATATLKGTGNTDAAILKSLSGRTEFDIKEGAVNGIDLWYELRRARALWKREVIAERAGPPRTTFKAFKGTALLDAGVARSDDLRVETDYLRAGGKGTIDLATKAIDYRLVAEVYEIPAEGAGAEMTDLKAAEIPITIGGTLAEPKVRPDLGALVKARVKEKVDTEIEQKKQEVKKKLGDKLRDLLGR